MNDKGIRVYGILSFNLRNVDDELQQTPMLVMINSKNVVYIQPDEAIGVKHFSLFAENEFNTSNYSIRSAATGRDFTFVDEIDPSSDYHLIKEYIELVLEVEPN